MNRTAAYALFLSLLVSCLALAQTPAPTPAPTQRIRGDVVSIDGLNLKVKERSGEMLTVKLAENYVVTAVAKVGIEAITPNAFVAPRACRKATVLIARSRFSSSRNPVAAATRATIPGTCSQVA